MRIDTTTHAEVAGHQQSAARVGERGRCSLRFTPWNSAMQGCDPSATRFLWQHDGWLGFMCFEWCLAIQSALRFQHAAKRIQRRSNFWMCGRLAMQGVINLQRRL